VSVCSVLHSKAHDDFKLACAGVAAVQANEDLLVEATSLVKCARVTKVSGVIIHHCITLVSLEELRKAVQAEIREFRSFKLTEKAELHPVLYERVRAALAMKPVPIC
jgi:hypothetical protein